MSSPRRIAASRANGALARGRKTPEGVRRSSRNATRHGLLAKIVVLDNEAASGFQAVCDDLAGRLAPRDGVELGCVEEMAASFWRMRRAWAIETSLLDRAAAQDSSPDEVERIAAAFSGLAAGPELNLLHRYETRLQIGRASCRERV